MQECVRRRAVLSLMNRPQVAELVEKDRGKEGVEVGEVGGSAWERMRKEKAEAVVDGVWESCAGDTRPFDEIYR
jgi:hypothetical protein